MDSMDPSGLLYMLYLANDVILSKRPGGADAYGPEFAKVPSGRGVCVWGGANGWCYPHSVPSPGHA